MLPEKSVEELELDLMVDEGMLRRLEDIEYWRKRAGWYDDEVSMKEFNNGVYDTYYQLDDDNVNRRHKSGTSPVGNSKGLATFLKIGAVVLAVVIAILLYRALSRRSSSSNKDRSSKGGSSDSKTRSRSKSASRSRSSRSRSRSRRASSSGNYDLMDDKSESRSRKSSRSRSRSRKHSTSRKSRSRSKSRSQAAKEVLV